jgi:hypothetical protein
VVEAPRVGSVLTTDRWGVGLRAARQVQTLAHARRLRDAPFTIEFERSVAVAWNVREREPRDLRQAVRFVRAAWINETPIRLTEGFESVGPDGNPRFHPEAERFIFGPPDDLEDDEPGAAIRYRLTPFRATLDTFENGDDKMRHQANLIRRVTAGEMLPGAAAIAEGVPAWAAKDVAEHALRAFLACMTDVVVREAPRN